MESKKGSSRKKRATLIKSLCARTFKQILTPPARSNLTVCKAPKLIHCTTQGEHYDLKSIYDEINARYFENKLNLKITWFGNAERKAKTCRMLGLYDHTLQLVKIHKLLDHPKFPPYFLSYVVYHEMLHHVYPPKRGRRGRREVHHSTFKEKERLFAEYRTARQFEKENITQFLT